MDIQLVLTKLSPQCQQTEAIWQSVCDTLGLVLQVYDIDSTDGQGLIDKLNIMTFPALIVDNKVIAVGRPDKDVAMNILSQHTSS